ncbi:MAG: glutamine synthetase III [Streptococcaceae bacterium]|jgi:glutamine synthetase|nr:glutamine synthetase III [Streptococcaceae bacterium]
MSEKVNVPDIFAEDVFTDAVMKQRLPKSTYKAFKKATSDGLDLDLETADIIANEIKEWAIEKGATHFAHLFQPLTGFTAEKQDAFITAPDAEGKVLNAFSGKELVKGEPDGSSFPSGGLRATFEARGYTVWDITSPVFVRHDAAGTTLLIPTAFYSYNGEALDQKAPLLRSMQTISDASIKLLQAFGKSDVTRVTPSVGPEQEYFLVDGKKFLERKDLIYAGRTLFGAAAPKGQELDDHYFGTIRQRVAGFMKNVNEDLWKVGITAKTQHNEVAPAQHEIAPIYDDANVAVDHNQVVMQTLKRVACQHGMKALLHEKPFAGVNGSGKHNNWSLVTNKGENLLEPGDTPHANKQFLVVLVSILKAVDTYAGLLRASAADPGNDHRLGANEAPPAIISVFLGSQLDDVLKQYIARGKAETSIEGGILTTGSAALKDISKDATDRNRTSPFAFTGNKFEFRMVGSRDSIAGPNIVLNTIVAESFEAAAERLSGATDFDQAVDALISEWAKAHQRIIFNGDGYSDEWVKEAEKRGLPNLKNMVEATEVMGSQEVIDLYTKYGVLTPAELKAREEVRYENYTKVINIEALTMIEMASKQYIPAVIKYTKTLADTVNAVKAAGVEATVQIATLAKVSALLVTAQDALTKLESAIAEASLLEEGVVTAKFFHDTVFPAMNDLRDPIDALEVIVDKAAWPVPAYGDLLFEV